MPSVAPALAIALLAVLPLSGCALTDSLRHERQGTVSSARALEMAWRTPASRPAWVPADATRIRYVASTRGSADRAPATVRVITAERLPDDCAEAERRTSDAFAPSWAPRSVPDRIERCGNWAVVRMDDGWFGWTPVDAPQRRPSRRSPSTPG